MEVRIRVLVALMATLTTAVQAAAPQSGTRFISLRECLELALSRNLDLRIEQLTHEIAGYKLRAGYGIYSPVLSFAARRDYVDQPGDFDPQKSNPDFPYELTTDTAGPSLAGRLPTGLDYALKGNAGEKSAITDFTGVPNTAADYFWGIRQTNNYFADTAFTARQHLLRDFWIDADRLNLRVLKKDLKISEQLLRLRVASTILAVELAYYDLLVARGQIGVEEAALKTQQQLVAETRRRVELGDLPELDADQVETQLQNTLKALSAARETHATHQNLLKSLVADRFLDWADVEFVPVDPMLAIPPEVNRSESFQRALKNRPDLVEARLNVEKSEANVQFRVNQLFPAVDFIGQYGSLGVQPESSTAIRQATEFRNPMYYYGVVVSYPLGNVAERNNYRASKAARERSELQLKKVEEAVLVQVADWTYRVQSRYEQIGYARKARTHAEAALEAEIKKLKNGLSTSFVVLQLQQTLTEARAAEVQAVADYNKAQAQLTFAEGNNLEKQGLSFNVNP